MKIQSRSGERKPNTVGVILAGLVIISFGLTLLANNLGWADAHQVLRQVWPLGLVVLGIAAILQRGQGLWGIALIVAGAWGYATQQHWLRVSFWAVFGPTMVVLVGGAIIWRALHRPRPAVAPGEAYIRTFAILSGSELRPTAQFEGADLNAVLGGSKLDLSAATMTGDSAVIEVFTVMGGIEILVPQDWNVTTEVTSFMGACVDKRRPSTTPRTKRLIVRGFALMGGVDIKD